MRPFPTCVAERMRAAILALAFFALSARADHVQHCFGGAIKVPDGLKAVCSASWVFASSCTSEDLWDKWQVTGPGDPKDAFIRPWEPVPIAVLGYELVKIDGREQARWIDRIREFFWSLLNARRSWFMI